MKTFLCSGSTAINWVIFTSRERGLGKVIFFTLVCYSFRGEGLGVGFPACITGHMTGVCIQREGLHLGRLCVGDGSASRGKGVCIQGKNGLHTWEGRSAYREVGQTP